MRDLLRARRWADRGWHPDDTGLLVGGVAGIAVVLVVVALLLDRAALYLWTAFSVLAVLVFASLPLFRWVARKEGDDPWLARVLMWALFASFVFSALRYGFIFVLYDGSGDAPIYHEAGRTFAERLRQGEPLHPIPAIEPYPVESQRIGDAAGVVYTLTGPSIWAGFFVFTYICFWGKVLMVRAFKAAVPEGDHRRFALLVLFLPSLLFWPSSIGKEALLMGCLGLIVYGGALLLAPRPRLRGALFFAIGASLVMLVRPHVALMSILGLGLAMAVGVLGGFGGSGQGAVRGRSLRLVALVVVVVLAVIGSTRVGDQFEEYAEGGAEATLAGALEQSSIGDSEFTPVAVSSVTDVPAGIISVLFRPFPWEARSLSTLVTAAESLVLVGLIAFSWRRLFSLPRLLLRRPFLVFCLSYVVLFSIGFSFIGNFGILARQRVLVLPIVLMFLALPRLESAAARRAATREERATAEPRSVTSTL
jgi:hypothetical protein